MTDRVDLDVERLAKAYHKKACKLGGMASHACVYMDAHRRSMALVAAEYARLVAESKS